MGEYYIKHNNSGYADALRREADGLHWLTRFAPQTGIGVPRVYRVDDASMEMERIASSPWSDQSWCDLGKGLALLHRKVQPFYGFEADNYIGLNPQKNNVSASWGDFFVDFRLGFQIGLIKDQRVAKRFWRVLADNRNKLAAFLDDNCRVPALLHGDLWRGNVLCDSSGGVWLIDPAVYFGDGEVDIAMSEMFGGFGRAFYEGYRQVMPLSGSYPRKRLIYNLYHYLNHYNLFGCSYLGGCEKGFEAIADL